MSLTNCCPHYCGFIHFSLIIFSCFTHMVISILWWRRCILWNLSACDRWHACDETREMARLQSHIVKWDFRDIKLPLFCTSKQSHQPSLMMRLRVVAHISFSPTKIQCLDWPLCGLQENPEKSRILYIHVRTWTWLQTFWSRAKLSLSKFSMSQQQFVTVNKTSFTPAEW